MATAYQDRKIPAPQLNEGDAAYFEAATQGKLLVKYCNDCQQYHHYPRPLCPFCFSNKTEWRQAKGTGTVYSYSITRASGPVPYAIGNVTLNDGVSVVCPMAGKAVEEWHAGDAVAAFVLRLPASRSGEATVDCFSFQPRRPDDA